MLKEIIAEEVKCRVCKKRFWRYKRPRTASRMKGIKRYGSVNCSSKCSKIYSRKKVWKKENGK